jgi:hypothetical protein
MGILLVSVKRKEKKELLRINLIKLSSKTKKSNFARNGLNTQVLATESSLNSVQSLSL